MKAKVISTLFLISFIGAGIFSFTHALDMAKGSHHAGDCPLAMGQDAICNLSPLAHLTNWQQTTTFNPNISTLLLLAALVFVFWIPRGIPNSSPPRRSSLRIAYAQLPIDLYTRIFSDGILNSKAY